MPTRIGVYPSSPATSDVPNRFLERLDVSTVDFTNEELGAIRFVAVLIADADIANALYVRALRSASVGEANELCEEMRNGILNACEHDEDTSETKTPERVVEVFASFETIYSWLRLMCFIPDTIYELLQSVANKSKDRFMQAVAVHVGLPDINISKR